MTLDKGVIDSLSFNNIDTVCACGGIKFSSDTMYKQGSIGFRDLPIMRKIG